MRNIEMACEINTEKGDVLESYEYFVQKYFLNREAPSYGRRGHR